MDEECEFDATTKEEHKTAQTKFQANILLSTSVEVIATLQYAKNPEPVHALRNCRGVRACVHISALAAIKFAIFPFEFQKLNQYYDMCIISIHNIKVIYMDIFFNYYSK